MTLGARGIRGSGRAPERRATDLRHVEHPARPINRRVSRVCSQLSERERDRERGGKKKSGWVREIKKKTKKVGVVWALAA